MGSLGHEQHARYRQNLSALRRRSARGPQRAADTLENSGYHASVGIAGFLGYRPRFVFVGCCVRGADRDGARNAGVVDTAGAGRAAGEDRLERRHHRRVRIQHLAEPGSASEYIGAVSYPGLSVSEVPVVIDGRDLTEIAVLFNALDNREHVNKAAPEIVAHQR